MFGNVQPIELAAPHRVKERDAIYQLVAARREDATLRDAMHGVIGATDALQEDRDAARRAELAHQLDVADVDAELERGGGHHHLEFAGLETLLGIEAGFLRETAVVGRDILLTETLGEVAGHALHHAAGVGEHQRGVVFFDEPGELVVHRRPDLARHHRLQRRGRHHQVDVAFADVATVDDAACSAAGKRFEGFARKQFVLWTTRTPGVPSRHRCRQPTASRHLRWASASRTARCAGRAARHSRPCAPA